MHKQRRSLPAVATNAPYDPGQTWYRPKWRDFDRLAGWHGDLRGSLDTLSTDDRSRSFVDLPQRCKTKFGALICATRCNFRVRHRKAALAAIRACRFVVIHATPDYATTSCDVMVISDPVIRLASSVASLTERLFGQYELWLKFGMHTKGECIIWLECFRSWQLREPTAGKSGFDISPTRRGDISVGVWCIKMH